LLASLVTVFVPTARGEIVFQDDFGSGLIGWTIGSHVTLAQTGGMDGSPAVRIRYERSGTQPHILSRKLPGKHQELYIRFHFKVVGFPSGGAKFLKVRAFRNNTNYANTTWAIDQKSGSLREVSFGAGRMVNDTQETINYSGRLRGETGPVRIVRAAGPYRIREGEWQSFEAQIKLNSSGQRDGVYRVWIDDRLILHAENIVNRNDENPLHINQLLLGDYCQKSWAAPWELYYDDVVIATDPIGSKPRSAEVEPLFPTGN
jgi:hypothetical protein